MDNVISRQENSYISTRNDYFYTFTYMLMTYIIFKIEGFVIPYNIQIPPNGDGSRMNLFLWNAFNNIILAIGIIGGGWLGHNYKSLESRDVVIGVVVILIIGAVEGMLYT